MIRGDILKGLDHDPNFRWRGDAVTRIENLSDIVFAIAFGMLVSAANPPQTMSGLSSFLFSIIPVTAAFTVLVGLWNLHFTFFRRYGVADKRIIFLNAILLFVVLYLAYPLRFAFDSLFAGIIGMSGDTSQIERMEMTFADSGIILAYFGIGFAVVHGLFALMHQHITTKRELLALTQYEFVITQQSVFAHWGNVVVSLFVAALAYFTDLNGWAGCFMGLIGFVHFIKDRRYRLPTQDD